MLKINRWTIRLSLLLILLLIIWLIIKSQNTNKQSNSAQNPDSFITQVHVVQINRYGKLKSITTSPNALHYQFNNKTEFKKPNMILYVKKGPPWHIYSNHGQALQGTDTIILTGNVHFIQPPGYNSHNVTLITSKMTLYPNRSYAETDQPVTILRPGSKIHAIGLQADLNKGEVKLMSHIYGQYDTNLKDAKKPTFQTSQK